ncbi:MAG TPA: hypothetical protein VNZ45_02070, partial [Bacteroidia bacterium]|nr:hypothetical protein [Bacteroidia bacterium]
MQAQITKIKNLLLYLLGFVVGCDIHLAPIFVVAFALCWIAEGNLKKKLSAFVSNKYALLLVLFYVLHIIGLIYTPDKAAGGFDLQVKLSMLIFPIMLVSEGEMSFGRQKLFIESFVAGLCMGGLICLGYGCWRYFTEHVVVFEYMKFSIFHHPSYYSMYIDTALVMMFYLLTRKVAELKKWEKIFLISATFFLAFMLVLLESKSGLIISIVVFLALFTRFIIMTKRWYLGLAIVSGIVVLGALTYIYVIKPQGSRFSVAMDALSGKQVDTKSTESTQARLFVWQSAWTLIKTV